MIYKLSEILTSYVEKNLEQKYQPVAVGKYGIRKREDIYKKDLAKDYSKNKVIRKDTLTIGMGSTQIDIGILIENEVYSVSPAYHTYKIITSIVDSEFLEWILKEMNPELSKLYMISSARQGKSVDFERMMNHKINIPTLEKQLIIIKKLKHIDKLISNMKTNYSKYDEIVKSQFIEMFGDPKTNSLGLPTQRFDTIAENLDYRRRPITAKDRKEGIYPYYGASGIVDYVEDYIFDEDILLISEDGANLVMRSTPIAFSVSGKVWVNNHAHVVKFENFATQKYIEYYFEQIDLDEYITGSAQPKFNQAKLNGMLIPIPTIELQNKFADFVQQIDKSKLNRCFICL